MVYSINTAKAYRTSGKGREKERSETTCARAWIIFINLNDINFHTNANCFQEWESVLKMHSKNHRIKAAAAAAAAKIELFRYYCNYFWVFMYACESFINKMHAKLN